MKIDHLNGRIISHKNREYIYLSGTDYLGMAYNQNLRKAIIRSYDQFGLNYGSTRKHGLFEDIYSEAESLFATKLGLESGLTVSSGTLAGQLVRNAVKALSYAIIEAPRLHPALKDIVDDMVTPRIQEMKSNFIEDISKHPSDKIAVLLVAVDPLTIELANFDFLQHFTEKELLIIIDDTHGLGVLGEDGGGYLSLYPELRQHNVVLISSLAKGISLPGGLIAGPKSFVDRIRNSGHFAGSSPMSPPYLKAYVECQKDYRSQMMRLRENINTFLEHIDSNISFRSMKDFPIFWFTDPEVGEALKSKGLWLSSIRYPYPHSDLLNRVILNGTHEESDILNIAHQINEHYKGIN